VPALVVVRPTTPATTAPSPAAMTAVTSSSPAASRSHDSLPLSIDADQPRLAASHSARDDRTVAANRKRRFFTTISFHMKHRKQAKRTARHALWLISSCCEGSQCNNVYRLVHQLPTTSNFKLLVGRPQSF